MSERILRDAAHTLEVEFRADGDLVDAGTVTIDIIRADGTLLVDDGATTNPSLGVYQYALAPQADLDDLEARWSGTVSGNAVTIRTYHEIVGAHLFTEAEARAHGQTTPLSDATLYTDAGISEARDRIADHFEDFCGVSFVPRFHRWVTKGNGKRWMYLKKTRPHNVQSVVVGDTTIAAADRTLDAELGKLYLTADTFSLPTASDPLNVTIEYDHGYDAPPLDIKRAALEALLASVVDSDIPERASSATDPAGFTLRFFQPGTDFPTGLPVVDEVLRRYRNRHKAWVA